MFHCIRVGERRLNVKNYRYIILLSMIGKIYVGILVDRVQRVTEGLIDDEQGGFITNLHTKASM